MANLIPGPEVPVVDQRGFMHPAWYRYFSAKGRVASAGEVLAGDGLDGGGFVADGIEIEIEAGGVTNAMLRQGAGTSVIGRFQGSAGQVADIRAMANGRYLARFGDILVFSPLKLEVFTVATVPDPAVYGAGALIYVSDETGGAVPAIKEHLHQLT